MLNDSSTKTAKPTLNATKSRTFTPATTSAAKQTSKPRVKTAAKPSVKHVAKVSAKDTSRPTSKTVPSTKAAKKDLVPKANKNAKSKKIKLVRDSFTMPDNEYGLIATVKKRCLEKGLAVKKSEVLRAAIINLASQSDAIVMEALLALEAIKTGRPSKGQK